MRRLHDSLPLSVAVFFITTVIAMAALGVTSQAAEAGFARAVLYSSGGFGANSLAVGDLNGDGYPDLVVTTGCPGYGCVGVLSGNGDGTFQPAVMHNSGLYATGSVAIADVNEDGKMDLVVTEGQCCAWYVSVLLGNGDGTFQNPITYASGGYEVGSVAVADMNGDGHPDLVVTDHLQWGQDEFGGVEVLLGNGDGTFQPAGIYSCARYAGFVAIADLNGDGNADIVVTTGAEGIPVEVLLGNGDGTFQPAVSYDSGSLVNSVAIADVNGDGKPDLLVANCGSGPGESCGFGGTVGVLLGNGDGTFQPVVKYDTGGISANSVAVADVNGDGKPDLSVATIYMWCGLGGGCSNNGRVAVLPGNGDGTFQAPVMFETGPHAPWSAAVTVATADLNGDNKPDLLVSKANGFIAVLLNNFAATTTTALISSLNPSFVNQSVTFTATVSSTPTVPDGQILTFYDGTTALASVALTAGTAAYTTSTLSPKTHQIKAKYAGNIWFKRSSGMVTQVVRKYPTTTSLTSHPNPSGLGQAVTFTATVTPSGPYAVSGKVKFWDGSTGIGTASLSGGIATLNKSTLAVGTHAITAQYLSDAFNDKSTSPVLNQVVQ